jgi:hypothetical protein
MDSDVNIDKYFRFVLFFCLFYFLLGYFLAITWYESQYFSVVDIFFQSNPSINLKSFSHGWGGHAISHPFLEFFTVPVRAVEFVCSLFFDITDRFKFRELVALAISPAFSSLTLLYLYKTLIVLNIKPLDAIIFTLIFSATFTNIIFSIIPESYGASCFLISVLLHYFFTYEKSGGYYDWIVWFILAVSLAGVTITNICIFSLVFFIHLLKNKNMNCKYAAILTAFYALFAFLAVMLFYQLTLNLLDLGVRPAGSISWISKWLQTDMSGIATNAINFFSASINSFFGIFPEIKTNEYCKDVSCNAIYFNRNKSHLVFLVIVALVWAFFLFYSRKFLREKKWVNLYIICSLIVAYNFILHIFFGTETFLYTQHWIVPLFLLMIPLLEKSRMASIILLILLVVVNGNFLLSADQLVGYTEN